MQGVSKATWYLPTPAPHTDSHHMYVWIQTHSLLLSTDPWHSATMNSLCDCEQLGTTLPLKQDISHYRMIRVPFGHALDLLLKAI